jgi:hypothetical protein
VNDEHVRVNLEKSFLKDLMSCLGEKYDLGSKSRVRATHSECAAFITTHRPLTLAFTFALTSLTFALLRNATLLKRRSYHYRHFGPPTTIS